MHFIIGLDGVSIGVLGFELDEDMGLSLELGVEHCYGPMHRHHWRLSSLMHPP